MDYTIYIKYATIQDMIIERTLSTRIQKLLKTYPVVTLTGCRQCGKSTLLKHLLPDYKYVSLEDLDIRQVAETDPRHFLSIYKDKTIIDEIQRVPSLLSYIQTAIDLRNETGVYVLTGSHNLLLMQSISQSLAGRTALLTLAPFSVDELKNASLLPETVNQVLYKGMYPRIYDKNIDPIDFYPAYTQTYIERDVRLLKNISDVSTFHKFLKLCAGRCSQLLQVSALADDCGISRKTAEAWLSVLETSYIIYFLKPYHKNFGKRLIKNAKMYFYDTGLVASLLGITQAEQIETFYMRGALFENFIVSELYKKNLFEGLNDNLYFWRDSNGLEVDIIEEKNLETFAYEIKACETMNRDFMVNLKKLQTLSGIKTENTNIIYGGEKNSSASEFSSGYISWRNVTTVDPNIARGRH